MYSWETAEDGSTSDGHYSEVVPLGCLSSRRKEEGSFYATISCVGCRLPTTSLFVKRRSEEYERNLSSVRARSKGALFLGTKTM